MTSKATKPIERRAFLGRAAAGLAALGAVGPAPGILGAAESRKLKAGLVGCGWYGMVDLNAALKAGGVEFVALCDVDSEHLEKSAGDVEKIQGTRPKTFKEYQDLLQTPGLEILFIATPPQWHALVFIAALEKGLDVYCEKPLAYDIREGQAMVAAAKKHGRIVQIGFQRRQSDAINQARDHVRSGKAGRVVQVDVRINYTASMKDWKPQQPPPSLDWDRWCGPGPLIPYSPNVGHFAWRLEAAYGNGHLVDWGIHLIDATRRILGETMPRTVSAAGGNYFFKEEITTPDVLTVHFDFETCPVVWRHRIWGAAEADPDLQNGIFCFCEKETIFATDDRWMIIPRKGDRKVVETKTAGEMQGRHVADFLEAVRTRRPPACTPEDGYSSTTTVQLGMIAYRVGSKIAWDGSRGEMVGNPEATRLLKREYRAPYKHPYQNP